MNPKFVLTSIFSLLPPGSFDYFIDSIIQEEIDEKLSLLRKHSTRYCAYRKKNETNGI